MDSLPSEPPGNSREEKMVIGIKVVWVRKRTDLRDIYELTESGGGLVLSWVDEGFDSLGQSWVMSAVFM